MNRALLKKCLIESILLLLACCTAMLLLCWLHVWFVSRLEMGEFAKVIEPLWKKYNKFSPVDLSQLLTYPGRIARAYSEPMVTLCIAVWAIARGSDCVSGEIGRGSMEILLAQPVSRTTALFNHTIITFVGLVLLTMCSWLGIYTGIQRAEIKETTTPSVSIMGFRVPIPLTKTKTEMVPMRDRANPVLFAYPAINLFFLGFCLAGLTAMMSSWDRYRWRTIGIVIAIWIIQVTFRVMAMTLEEYQWLGYCTLFTAYDPEVIVAIASTAPEQVWNFVRETEPGQTRLAPMGYNAILASLGVIFYIAAFVIFRRRDIPAPL
ncbi:MAG: ABC-2 type transport system permease protein [Pirellulaceae bacterium]|jgi:ABC-2 type transport system permease protein